jgi:catechol 2,3-dioxygenase-like lactoylglutathione lyase family enzyme
MLEFHIGVENIEKSLELYTKLLPYKEISWWKDRSAVALILEDGSAFGIWHKDKIGSDGGRPGKHLHYAFQINPEEYDHYLNLVKNLGLQPIEHQWPNARSIYFQDFDGHQGEFMTADWLHYGG